MAIWRLPNTTVKTGVTDLRPDLVTTNRELEMYNPGFVLNPFDNHHPCAPDLIKADLKFEWSDDRSPELHLDPTIPNGDLERFAQHLVEPPFSPVRDPLPASPDYRKSVSEAVTSITGKQFDKVVISRCDDIRLPEGFNPVDTFNKACDSYPNAFVYLLYSPEHGVWLGATPETFLSLRDRRYFETMSLAGTQKLEPDQTLSTVAWTQKEIEEQAMVSRYIIDCFKKIRLREFTEAGPKTVKAGNLAHLKTEYRVDMEEVNMNRLGSIMMDLLHPTSAVCGMPLRSALEFIKSHESYDRELYAGFLGPVNIENNTHLFVNLRCMKIINGTGRFFAGAGITEDSDPEMEFIETEMKMQTLKRLIFE